MYCEQVSGRKYLCWVTLILNRGLECSLSPSPPAFPCWGLTEPSVHDPFWSEMFSGMGLVQFRASEDTLALVEDLRGACLNCWEELPWLWAQSRRAKHTPPVAELIHLALKKRPPFTKMSLRNIVSLSYSLNIMLFTEHYPFRSSVL